MENWPEFLIEFCKKPMTLRFCFFSWEAFVEFLPEFLFGKQADFANQANIVAPFIDFMSKFLVLAPTKASESQCISTL